MVPKLGIASSPKSNVQSPKSDCDFRHWTLDFGLGVMVGEHSTGSEDVPKGRAGIIKDAGGESLERVEKTLSA